MLHHTSLVSFFCTLLLTCQLLTPTNSRAAETTSGYSIVLSSAPGKNLKWEPKNSHLFKGRTIYIEQTIIKGSPWERLCLGFFDNRNQAISLQKRIQKIYPGAWNQKTSRKNIARIIRTSTIKPAIKTVPKSKSVAVKAPTTRMTLLSEKQLDDLMQRAKSDFRKKIYTSAIRFLTALTANTNHKYYREALELLGLARQRNGQKTHAVNIYKKYLALYPDGDNANRVRQRLAGLLTAARAPRKKIRMTTVKGKDELTAYGNLSQFYRTNSTSSDDTDSITTLSQLITFFDLTTLQRSTNFDHRYQFTADHTYDFIDDRDNSEYRFSETYYELSYRSTGTSGRLGRQSLRIGGILNRFDGLSAGYQFNPDMRLNILGGFPVDIDNKTSINRHKTFYGLTFETGTFLDHWDMNLFYFDQEIDDLTDRNSIGTEVRYRDKSTSVFSMIDYDKFYKQVNILQLNANILFDNKRTAYMNAFMRKAPILATSNALIGRAESTIKELQTVLNIEQIYQLARDRTANSETVTVGGSLPVNKSFQFTADATLSRVGDTVASGGIPATPGTGTDYFLSTQLVGNSLLIKRDTSVIGLRYYDTEPSSTISLILNSRLPITRNWRINPRLQYDIRKLKDGRSQKKLRAIFKTDYRYENNVRFDFEVGYDDTSEENNGNTLGNNNLFLTLGYRWDF